MLAVLSVLAPDTFVLPPFLNLAENDTFFLDKSRLFRQPKESSAYVGVTAMVFILVNYFWY
jgi:hypothetical protein